ncbi:hypothetical protein [Scale drop disease virus]|uniref:Uncharacterized protein n=1 Tax=Scale drop disease virus TaxID=1697349 RepID=A0A7D5YSC7_9VIRU|nr:hypothetical protein [Scale drop disease virus]QXJ13654.1 hypothetical protein PMJGCIOK_00087 [Scale drop disease virus]UNH60720.1 hypothetical protein SDDV_ORF051 [Scale drop disease virus]
MDKLSDLPQDNGSKLSIVEKRIFDALGKISTNAKQQLDGFQCRDVVQFILIPSIAFMVSEVSPFQDIKMRIGIFVGVLLVGIVIYRMIY